MLDESPVLAADYMSRDVVSVHPDDTLRKAVKLMAAHRLSGLPVVNHAGEVVGMFTEGDLVRWHEGLTERQAHWLERLGEGYEVSPTYVETIRDANHLVRSVMSLGIVAVPDTMTAREAAQVMYERHVKRLPVLRDGRMVGIVSRSDLVRALADALDAPHDVPVHERHTIDEVLRHGREEALERVPKIQ